MKPGDLLLGVSDFFTILLPGVLAAWLAGHHLPDTLACSIDPGLLGRTCTNVADLTVRSVAFLLVSYLLGHFTFMAGSRLDKYYDRWRARTKPTSEDAAYAAAQRVRQQVTPDFVDGEFTLLKWAKAYIAIHKAEARVEIDRFEANSKFFRGLVVISAPLALHFLLYDRSLWLAGGAVGLGIASLWRYRDQRWKSTELAYGTVTILHAGK